MSDIMKKTVKSYLVFTSRLYRLVMFAVLPAAWAGICFWTCGMASHGRNGMLILTALFLPIAETISDSWLFAGIQTSSSPKLDYLKTSGRGQSLMRRALIMDVMRKLVFSGAFMGIGYASLWLTELPAGGGKGNFAEAASAKWGAQAGVGAALLCLIMLSFFFSVLGTFLSRYGNMIWTNVIVGYGIAALEFVSLFLPGLFRHPYAYAAGFGLLGLCVSVVAVRAAMGRMERSYYDEWKRGMTL